MVKTLFPATKNIDEVVGIIDKYRMKFEFNGTPGDFWQGSYLYTVRHSAKLYMNCLKGGK